MVTSLLPLALLASVSAVAQSGGLDGRAEEAPPVIIDADVGHTSSVNGNRVGQRQTREQVAPIAGITPMTRINSRVANRVQSRFRNRIDRYYDPSANATSPFKVAEERARSPK